jgi:hypothetical protein
VAIGATLLTSAFDGTDASSYATASVSPAASSLLLVFVTDTIGAGVPPQAVPTGLSLTWTELGSRAVDVGSFRRVSAYIAQCGASPGSGAITLTESDKGSGTTSTSCTWAVIQVTGHHVANPVRQVAFPEPPATAATTSASFYMSTAAADSNSRPFAWFNIPGIPGTAAFTPRASWTQLSANGGSSPNVTSQAQWRSDAFETSFSAGFVSSDEPMGIGLEIAEASAPAAVAAATVRTHVTTVGVADSTISVTMPSGVTAGELLIAEVSTNDAATTAAGGGEGWTEISAASNASAVRLTILAKIATGTDVLNLTHSGAVDSVTHVQRIITHGVSNVATDIVVGTPATGTSTAPNPPAVTPAANAKNLIVAVVASDDDDDINVFAPADYTAERQRQSASSGTSCLIQVAYRHVTTGSSVDPGVFALTSSEEWVAQTLCIPPGAESTTTPLPGLGEDIEIGVEIEWDEFSDVTADLREMTIRLPARSRLQAVFQAGSATLVLDNRLRTYDPLYAAGPNFGNLKANRRVRITLDLYDAGPSVIFTGWTDGWSFAYDKSNNDATATITCIDALAKAGFSAIPAGTTPALAAGEYVATRGDALVTAAGSTDITYSAADGYARFGTTWDATVQHNLLTELRRCAELEVAPLLALDDGTLHQEARYWFATRALSATSNCTIPSATLPCTEVRVLYDARELVSAVSMTDEVGNVATATNTAAVTEFGERYADLNFNNMPAGDASSLAGAAATWVGLRGGEEMRFDTVTILPQRSDDWWEHIQDRRPLDRVTVSLTPTDVGDPITQDAFIDGIEHHITPDTWVTTWHLLPADLYAAVDFFILDTDELDDTKVLGY